MRSITTLAAALAFAAAAFAPKAAKAAAPFCEGGDCTEQVLELRREVARIGAELARGGDTRALKARVTALEARVAALGGDTAALKAADAAIRDRLEGVLAALAALEARVTALEQRTAATDRRVTAVEVRTARIEGDRLGLAVAPAGGVMWVDDPRDEVRAPVALGLGGIALEASRALGARQGGGISFGAGGFLAAGNTAGAEVVVGGFARLTPTAGEWRLGAKAGYLAAGVGGADDGTLLWKLDGVPLRAAVSFAPAGAPALALEIEGGVAVARAARPDLPPQAFGANPTLRGGVAFRF